MTIKNVFLIWLTVGCFIFVTPQSVVDSLEIYNPFDQFEDIRRIINNEFTILRISNNSLIKKLQSDLKTEDEKSDSFRTALIHVQMGDVYFTTSIYDYALDSYFNALRIFESVNDTLNIAKTKLKLRRTYYFADLLPLEDYLSEVDELLKNSKDYESLALVFYVKAMLAKSEEEKKKFLEKALTIQSLVIAENPRDKSHKYYLANFLNAAGKLEEAIKIAESIGDNWLLVLYLNNLGYKYVRLGDYKIALNIFYRTLAISKKERYKTFLRNIYENLARVYRLQGNWKKSANFMQITKGITESLYLERSSLQLSELKVKYDSERNAFENQHLKEEQQTLSKSVSFQKEFNILLILAIVIIGLILFYVYFIYQKLKRANVILDSQNIQILTKQSELEKLNNSLQENEKNLKDAQATAQLANWELNPLTNQLRYSEQLPIIFNIPMCESGIIDLKILFNNVHSEDEIKLRSFFDMKEGSKKDNMIEVRLVLIDKVKWIKIKKIVNRNEEGDLVRFSGTVQDISDIKEEEEIKIQIAEQQSFTKQSIHYQEEERKRIAGDLHDGLGQNVLLIKNRALLGLQNDTLDENLKKQFSEIDKLSSIVLDTTKEIAFNLRPAHLERLGLTDTIITTLEQSAAISKTDFKFNIEQIDNKLSNDNEINLFRIIQEAVNNILKHSNAINAFVEIKNADDKILVTITDDGKGIETSKKEKSKGGFGLRNMMSRVQMLNGEIEINTNDPKGTKIKISIPVEKL